MDNRLLIEALSTERPPFVDDKLLIEALSTEWRHLVDKHVSQRQ